MDASGVQTLGDRNPQGALSAQGTRSTSGTSNGGLQGLNDLTATLGTYNPRNTSNVGFANPLFPTRQPLAQQWPALPNVAPTASVVPAPAQGAPVVGSGAPNSTNTNITNARPLSPRDATEIVIDGQVFDPAVLPPIPVFADPTPDPTPTLSEVDQNDDRPVSPQQSQPSVAVPDQPSVRSPQVSSPATRPQTPTLVISPVSPISIRSPRDAVVALETNDQQTSPTSPIAVSARSPQVEVQSSTVRSPTASVRSPTARSPATSVQSPTVRSPVAVVRSPTAEVHSPSVPVRSPQTEVHSPSGSVTVQSPGIRSPQTEVRSPPTTTPHRYTGPDSVVTPIAVSSPMSMPTRQETPAVNSGRFGHREQVEERVTSGRQWQSQSGRSVEHSQIGSDSPTVEPGSPVIRPTSPITIPFSPLRDNPPVIPLPFSPSNVSPGPSLPDRSMMQVPNRPTSSSRSTASIAPATQVQDTTNPPVQPEPATQTTRSTTATTPAQPSRSLAERYAAMTPEERARIRADFRVKMGILRTAYPRFNIPDFPEETPLEEIHAQYERYVRQIYIDGNVDQYKGYLIILWLIIEVLCVRVLGLDLGGFTTSQMSIMNRYDRLLIELGEKDQGPTASNWPVEARIIILSLFNAFLFLIVKVVGSYLGNGMARMAQTFITGLLSGSNTQDLINDLNRAQANQDGENANANANANAPTNTGGGIGGGFDFGNIIGTVASVITGGLGGGSNSGGSTTTNGAPPARPRAARRPRHTE